MQDLNKRWKLNLQDYLNKIYFKKYSLLRLVTFPFNCSAKTLGLAVNACCLCVYAATLSGQCNLSTQRVALRAGRKEVRRKLLSLPLHQRGCLWLCTNTRQAEEPLKRRGSPLSLHQLPDSAVARGAITTQSSLFWPFIQISSKFPACIFGS